MIFIKKEEFVEASLYWFIWVMRVEWGGETSFTHLQPPSCVRHAKAALCVGVAFGGQSAFTWLPHILRREIQRNFQKILILCWF